MKGLSKTAMIMAKILEVCHWIGTGFMAVLLGLCLFARDYAAAASAEYGVQNTIYGFQVSLASGADGELSMAALTVFAVTGILLMALMAMVFRNIYLIIKTSRGETKFSKGETPFQPDNIRMVREIGIFSIAVPVVGLVMSIIGRAVIGPEFAEISVDLGGVVAGLIMLWLTNVFAYGAELQRESDGLI